MSEIDNRKCLDLTAEIERLRENRQSVKGAEAERVWRDRMSEEFKADLDARDGKLLDRFDGDLFRRLVEKVKVSRWLR
jgi:hypothetical protein